MGWGRRPTYYRIIQKVKLGKTYNEFADVLQALEVLGCIITLSSLQEFYPGASGGERESLRLEEEPIQVFRL